MVLSMSTNDSSLLRFFAPSTTARKFARISGFTLREGSSCVGYYEWGTRT